MYAIIFIQFGGTGLNYAEIINLIFSIISGLISLLFLPFVVFLLVGIFTKKKYKKAKVKHKYGIVISARNEEKVIGNLIDSIRKTDYPQDKLDIFVVAHNCTDNTAEVCSKKGAKVYVYNNENEKTKGYALKYLFNQLKTDLKNGIREYDGYYIFDADNLVTADYFDKMNDAFDAYGEKRIITSMRNSKNFGSNLMSGMYGMFFMYGCRYIMRGRAKLGVSSRVYGTGQLIDSKILKNGWNYVTITEDFELTADQVMEGNSIRYCDEAMLYDEQPTSFKVMWRQRVRWARGALVVFGTRFFKIVKELFSRKQKSHNRISLYDLIANVVPICIITICNYLLQFILLLFCPLFGIALWPQILGLLTNLGWTMLLGYIVLFLSAGLIFILERKRIPKMSFIKKIGVALFFPIFMALQFPLDVVALFSKNLTWKTIPHTDTTNVEMLTENEKTQETKDEL